MAFQPQTPFPKSRGDTIRSGDWNDLIGEVQRLDTFKVDRAGDAISGSLTVAGTLGIGVREPTRIPLAVNTGAPDEAPLFSLGTLNNEDFLSVFGGRRGNQSPFVAWKRGDLRLGMTNTVDGGGFVERLRITSTGNIGLGIPAPQGKLHIVHQAQDPNGNALIVGPPDAAHLRLGYNVNYSWIQSHGNRPLVINAVSNNVGVGTDSPYTTLTVSGSIGFTNGTTPMLYINQTGTANPERAIIAHSPAFPTYGLSYRDADDVMIFQGNGIPVLTVGLGTQSVTIPTAPLSFGAQTRQMINLWNTSYGIGVQSGTQYYRTGSHFAWFRGGSHNDTELNPGGGVRLMAVNSSGDFILSARTNPSANPSGSLCRALVDLGNLLVINFNGDYPNGVTVGSNFTVNGNAFKPGGGAWANSSDIRLKQHVRPLAGALDQLLRLRGVCFEWKEPEQQGNLTGPQMGMLAHEVEEVFPEWISTDPDGYKQLTIRGFEALMVEALRTLKAEHDEIKGQYHRFATRLGEAEAKLQVQLSVNAVHENGTGR
jgi:hypothetical protein